MAVTGKITIFVPERSYEVETKTCDICGGNSTENSHCDICKRDLCNTHQIIVNTHSIWQHNEPNAPAVLNPITLGGIYCKGCLIKALQAKFPE
jgi:hypothetical protein